MERRRGLTGLIFAMLLVAVFAFAGISASAESAQRVTLNTTVENSGTERNCDLYQIKLKNTGKLSINFKHKNLYDTKTYWTIEVLASDLETVLQTVDSTGVDTNLTAYSLGLSKGTYYIKVWSRKDCSDEYSSASYKLTPKFKSASNWEIEYNSLTKITNDKQAGARTTYINKKAYGTIGTSDDVDFYKVRVKKTGYVSLNITHKNVLDSDECWKVELVNSKTGTIVSLSSLGTDKSKTSPRIGLTPGLYYIKVTAGSKKYNSATYSVKLNFKSSGAWEKEYNNSTSKFNDSLTAANKLTVGKTMSGTIKDGDDVDCFKFKTGKSGKIKLIFTHNYRASTDTYWVIKIYDSKLREISEYQVAGVDRRLTRTLRLGKGTYYIQVSAGGSDSYSATPYKLTVKR